MGRRGSDQEETSDASGRDESGPMLVIAGWILIVGALLWAWMVFFAHQSEVGLWVAAAVGGLGYLLQRAGNRAS